MIKHLREHAQLIAAICERDNILGSDPAARKLGYKIRTVLK